jgi:hypothetical protein
LSTKERRISYPHSSDQLLLLFLVDHRFLALVLLLLLAEACVPITIASTKLAAPPRGVRPTTTRVRTALPVVRGPWWVADRRTHTSTTTNCRSVRRQAESLHCRAIVTRYKPTMLVDRPGDDKTQPQEWMEMTRASRRRGGGRVGLFFNLLGVPFFGWQKLELCARYDFL